MTRLKRGDLIRIRLAGSSEWVRGIVALASDTNPGSVALLVEGRVPSRSGAWLGGGFPVTVDYDAGTVTSPLLEDQYELELLSRQAFESEEQ